MPIVPRAFSATATDVLSSVSAAATTVTATLQSAANLADALEAHSAHYRDTTIAELALSTEAFKLITRDRARMRIARARLDLDAELTDPAFKRIFDSIKFDDELTAAPSAPTVVPTTPEAPAEAA